MATAPDLLGVLWSCPKVGHATREAARVAARRVRARAWGRVAVYYCNRCDAWHIGNTIPRKHRGRR